MINFDFVTLDLFLKETQGFLEGARFQKIQQPTRQELVIGLRNQGESRKLYININPNFFHVCFMSKENEQKRFIEIPQSPPMFCMLLRKYLESAKIAKVVQPENERILEFYFETYNELSEKIYLCLSIELMGKHSNVVLYNFDTNMIIGCMHNVGAEKSSVREIIGGLPYAYPPKRNNTILSGLSGLYNSETSGLSVNEFIDNYFAPLQEAEKIRAIKSKLLTVINAKLKKIKATVEKLKKQSRTVERTDLYRKKGDLIMANLFHNKDFATKIEVLDYETNSPLTIELDETKTLKENANQYYKLYNKSKTANIKSQEMLDNLEAEKEYLEQVLYSLGNADTIDDVLEIQDEMGSVNEKEKVKSGKKKTEKKVPQPLTLNHPPFTIYVGKNNKQNDFIVSKLARDEDLWFHVHNCAGSHVLLRVESGQEPSDEIIFKCAQLAKEYSSGKNSSKVGVIYTKAKFLKKPPGDNLGYVIYKGEKEIIVD